MSAFTQALQRMFDARPARPCSANDAQRPSPSHGDADVHHSRAGPPLAAAGDVLGGRFELIALIGEGGMSRVFKALDLRRQAGEADRHVAVKVLTEPFDAYFGSLEAVRREAHKVQSLSHPNIVRVIDCDRDGQRVFMTMEYLPGRSLQELLRASGPAGLPANDALRIIAAIGDALEHAHRNHIVHGDLKPANVIVTEQGGIKVIDFGVAKIVARADCVRGGGALPAAPPVRAPKAVTLRYASPETAAGEDPEASDDVYALACIAYEALSGRHAFGPRKAPDRIGSIDPALPPQMPMYQYMAIVRALATHRRHRTPTIRRFVDELLATHRRAAIERWLWALAAAVAMVGSAAYWTHAGRGHAPDPPSPRRLAAPGDGVRHGALS